MNGKKLVKEYERATKAEPDNLVLKLKYAAALREVGRRGEAVVLYLQVARAYHRQARYGQAMAVCKSVLEFEPAHAETQGLLAELDGAQSQRQATAAATAAASTPAPRTGPAAQGTPDPSSIAGASRSRPRISNNISYSTLPGRRHSGLTPANHTGLTPPEGVPAGLSRRGMPLAANPSEPAINTKRPSAPILPRTAGAARRSAPALPSDPRGTNSPPAMTTRRPPREVVAAPPAPAVPARPERRATVPPPPPAAAMAQPRRQAYVTHTPTPFAATPLPPPYQPTPTPYPVPSAAGSQKGPPPSEEEGMTMAYDPRWPGAAPADPPSSPPVVASDFDRTTPKEKLDYDDVSTRVADAHELPMRQARDTLPNLDAVGDDDPQATRVGGDEILEAARRAARPETVPPAAPARPPARAPASATAPQAPVSLPAGALDEDDHLDDLDDADDDGDAGPTRIADPSLGFLPGRGRAPSAKPVAAKPAAAKPAAAKPVAAKPTPAAPTSPAPQDVTVPRAKAPVAGSARRPSSDIEQTRVLDDSLELARAFDRPFAAAADELLPDGSAVEPLWMFSGLPAEARYELERRVIRRRFAPGDSIVREGEPGDACYVVQDGEVRVTKEDPANPGGEPLELVRLGNGSIFGEFALLGDRRRHASVEAVEPSLLYEIPRRLLRELTTRYAGVGPALERLYRERLISTLLATAPFFRALREDERVKLMSRFASRRVEAGEAIIREGQQGGGLYLLVLGTVDVTRRAGDGRRPTLLASLGEGTYFGEMSLLSGGVASATVTAAGPAELAQLPTKEFFEVLSAYPVLWQELRQEAKRRELANESLLSGDALVT